MNDSYNTTMSPLLGIYILWLILTFVIITVIVPRFVPDEYKDISVHITTFGFVLISLLSKFIIKLYDGTITYMFMFLFLLSIGGFITLVTGVYYWVPKYLYSFEQSTVDNILIGGFTASLIFINLYEQEYQDTIYKIGDVITMFGGKRKSKK